VDLLDWLFPPTFSETTFTRSRHVPPCWTGPARSLSPSFSSRDTFAGGDDDDNVANSTFFFLLFNPYRCLLSSSRRFDPHIPPMASSTIITNPQPLATTSHSRQNHLNRPRSFSSASGAFEDQDSPISRPNAHMSFNMSQGSQGSGLMMQPGGRFGQYDGNNGLGRRNSAPQIYSVSAFCPLMWVLLMLYRPFTQG
jgi:hypothetical protein